MLFTATLAFISEFSYSSLVVTPLNTSALGMPWDAPIAISVAKRSPIKAISSRDCSRHGLAHNERALAR